MIWIKLSFTSTKCEEVLLEYLGQQGDVFCTDDTAASV